VRLSSRTVGIARRAFRVAFDSARAAERNRLQSVEPDERVASFGGNISAKSLEQGGDLDTMGLYGCAILSER